MSAAPASPRRIGIFGGSFDPVHRAHVALARIAREHLRLDEIRWVPVGEAWQKSRQLAPAADRVAMVQLAIEGEAGFTLDTFEVDRGGPSYTVETVRGFQAREPGHQWWLVIGQDQHAHFDSWHGWQELLARVTLAVAGREGDAARVPAALAAVPHRWEPVPLPSMAVSSTLVRENLAAGRGIDGMVPDPVARYIDRRHLYQKVT